MDTDRRRVQEAADELMDGQHIDRQKTTNKQSQAASKDGQIVKERQ